MNSLKTSIVMAALLALAACQKSDNNASTDVTSTEAADMVASSLSANSNGLVNISADIAVNAQAVFDLNIGCGSTKTYTFSHSSPQGATTTYSYALNYSYTLNCNADNKPDNITGSSTDNGTFDGPRLSSTNTGASTFRIAGLTTTATVYVINGEYKRTGTFTSKVENKNTSTTVVDIVVTNLTINKSSKLITAGSATVTVTGTTTKKSTISFTGSVAFNGSGKATVTLNGTAYVVNLLTGEFSKA